MDAVTDDMATPSGVITFLFTDIERSTRRWEADANATAAALETHDEVMRGAVTMGVATGEAEQRGGDYFGAVLNRAARVMSAGHGGQILLDGQTAGLVNELDLIVLGTRRLRDLAQPVDVFQVDAPGLRAEFPGAEHTGCERRESAGTHNEFGGAVIGAHRGPGGAEGASVGHADRRRRGR
ncbi:MAG TPA: hypothetical protein VET27_13510 [Mycobacterium sp.]|nr:hypothetical protein [Mycobacterium sp.]